MILLNAHTEYHTEMHANIPYTCIIYITYNEYKLLKLYT